MEIKKQVNGITLISLVVTIIVLIILAGVSINLILGDNGIIKKVKEGKELSEKESIIEEIQLKILEQQIKGMAISKSNIKALLATYGTVQ